MKYGIILVLLVFTGIIVYINKFRYEIYLLCEPVFIILNLHENERVLDFIRDKEDYERYEKDIMGKYFQSVDEHGE